LNDHNIYFENTTEEGYRGVKGSIAIKNIYDKKNDDIRMG